MIRPAAAAAALVLGLSAPILSGCATLPSPAQQAEAIGGKTVVVTGASSGFGKGIALALADRRANVVLAARRTELLEQVALEVRARGGRALVVTTDVANEADMARLAEAAVGEFGRIDVWINNAGVGALGAFEETPLQDHARIVDVNLKGVVYGSWHAMRQFRQQGSGTLINMGSVVSQAPMPYYASYVSTKHGVLGLGAALNQELNARELRRIKVVTIMPHAADTPWFDHAANYSGRSPRRLPSRIMADDPQKIVDAVMAAIVRPRPRIAVGWKAKGALAAHRIAPGVTEAVFGGIVHRAQMAPPPEGAPPGPGSLHRATPVGTEVDAGIIPDRVDER